MGLGFNDQPSTGGGKFLPVVKFDAKSGDFIAVNREPAGDGTWEKKETEISFPVKVVMALDAIDVGWIMFTPTYNASMVRWEREVKYPAQPSADHKKALRLKIFFKEHGLREFTPTSATVRRAVDVLHDQYLEQAPSNQGKIPVVTIEGTETVKVQTPQGELRFKAPKWHISGWVAPPEEMKEAAPQPAKPAKALDEEEF